MPRILTPSTTKPSAPFLALVLLLSGGLSACLNTPSEVLYPSAPTLLSGTEPAMNTAGYWIGRHPAPDQPILDADGIALLNRQIRERKGVRDLADQPAVAGPELTKTLTDTVTWVGSLKVYQRSGHRVDRAFLAPLTTLMATDTIPARVENRYGFVTQSTDLRVLPTNEPLYDGPGDPFIDNLQASRLGWGTPVIVRHQSLDGEWLYVITDLTSGWLSTKTVALADRQVFVDRYRSDHTAVVIAAKADLFADPALTQFLGSVRMGTPLVVTTPAAANDREPVVGVSVVTQTDGTLGEVPAWVAAAQVHEGVLPYTARTVYQQVFKLLNAPYGWGGRQSEQDCSQLLCEVFACAGVILPRNSTGQSRVGVPLPGFSPQASDEIKQQTLVDAGLPGATLLRLPGHIMLYLGTVHGQPYVIHSTWAYREKRGLGEVVRLINRVTVSNLELGQTSQKGSLLHRVSTVVLVTAAANQP